jgi:hypothetical protein
VGRFIRSPVLSTGDVLVKILHSTKMNDMVAPRGRLSFPRSPPMRAVLRVFNWNTERLEEFPPFLVSYQQPSRHEVELRADALQPFLDYGCAMMIVSDHPIY